MMEILLTSAAFVVAAICVGLMGYAVQRGATCTVAAVDEWVNKRSVNRLLSMLEASLWVAGGMLIAHALHRLPAMPSGHALSPFTVLGGALLGVGAFVNRACVFGAIARLGSGEWAYVATPLGFYVGCASVDWLLPRDIAPLQPIPSPIFDTHPAITVLLLTFMLTRVGLPLMELRRSESGGTYKSRVRALFVTRVWSPHAATGVIGITFLFLLLLMGSWAYTDVLADLARGMGGDIVVRMALFFALLSGAVIGGWTAGRFKSGGVSGKLLLRCFVGGVLMGCGSLMIPGSNDGLILLGMPLLWPYAWVAFVTMCASIGVAMWLSGPTGRQGQ